MARNCLAFATITIFAILSKKNVYQIVTVIIVWEVLIHCAKQIITKYGSLQSMLFNNQQDHEVQKLTTKQRLQMQQTF